MPEIHNPPKRRRGNASITGRQMRVPEKPYWEDFNDVEEPAEQKEDLMQMKETATPSRSGANAITPRSRRRKRPLANVVTFADQGDVGDSLSKVTSPPRLSVTSPRAHSNEEKKESTYEANDMGQVMPKLERLLSGIQATLDSQKSEKDDRIKQQQSLIHRIENICERQERALEETLSKLAQSEASHQDFKRELVSLKASFQKLQKERHNEDDRLKSLESRLAESQEQERSYAAKLLELTNGKRSLEATIRKRDAQIQAMSETNDSVKYTYQTRVSEVQETLRKTRAELKRVNDENQELKDLWSRQKPQDVKVSPSSRRVRGPADRQKMGRDLLTAFSTDIVPSSSDLRRKSYKPKVAYKTGSTSNRSSRAKLKGNIPSFDCLADDRLSPGQPFVTIDSD